MLSQRTPGPTFTPKNEVGKLFGEVPFQFFMLANASTRSISHPKTVNNSFILEIKCPHPQMSIKSL
jgi:hypothetical protein